MTPDYDTRNLEILSRHDQGENFAGLGRAYGLSRTRIWQIVVVTRRKLQSHRHKAQLWQDFRQWRDRDQPIENLPGEVIEPEDTTRITGERLIRAFYRTLPVLLRDAKAEVERRRLAALTPAELQEAEDRRLRRKQQKRTRMFDGIAARQPWRRLTQEELRAEVDGLHWTEVVYRSGTDVIVRLERR